MVFIRYKSLLLLLLTVVMIYLFVFFVIFLPLEKLNTARTEELEAVTEYQETLRRVDFGVLKRKADH